MALLYRRVVALLIWKALLGEYRNITASVAFRVGLEDIM